MQLISRGGMLTSDLLGGFFRFSRNPLGIIALFIVLIYGVAGFVTTSSTVKEQPQLILTIFLVIFPFAVLWSFHQLVSKHFYKLFGPQDMGQGEFLRIARAYLPAGIIDTDAALEVSSKSDREPDDNSGKENTIDLQAKLLRGASQLDRTSLYIDAIWNSREVSKKRSIFKNAFRQSKDLNHILSDEKNRSAIFDVLNFLEEIAAEIFAKKLDPAEVRQRVRVVFNVYWPNAKRVIARVREETKLPESYANLERLAAAWSRSRDGGRAVDAPLKKPLVSTRSVKATSHQSS